MMETNRGNLFDDIPEALEEEVFEELVASGPVRIERILSRGHRSPATGWYDQDEHEWVAVPQGEAKLEFEDGRVVHLGVGEHLLIPAHVRHRVIWTDPDRVTVWLAVFYTDGENGGGQDDED